MNKELYQYLHRAGQLASELEEVMGQAEMVCREDNKISQELWQEVEEREADAQSVNSCINDLVEQVAIANHIKETA